jgi:AcrR family transcriptional regulator
MGGPRVDRDHGDGVIVVDDRRERILDVAERLFAERGFRNVSVRDIAAEAQVTHPLIYYYWSSKDDLLAAVLARSQGRIMRLPEHSDRLKTVTAVAREALEHNRHYLLTLTRALLDGLPPSAWPGGFPAIDLIVGLVTDGDGRTDEKEARSRVAAAVAMLYGWTLIEDALLEMVGLAGDDRDRARQVLLQAIGDVVAPALEDR